MPCTKWKIKDKQPENKKGQDPDEILPQEWPWNGRKACQREESGTRDKVEISSLDGGEDGDEFSQMWNERVNWQRLLVCFVLNSYTILSFGDKAQQYFLF